MINGPLLPNLTRQGRLIRCGRCGCSVNLAHRPNSVDCKLLIVERIHKYRS